MTGRTITGLRLILPFLAGLSLAGAEPSVPAAIKFYQESNFSAARAALEKIVAADPANAAACYYLGMAIRHRGDVRALDDAVVWLGKAVALAPENETYLADYGGTCLELADQHHSFDFAVRGRDAMEKAIRLNPDDLDAREGLMRFYAQAPWPLGSNSQARIQAGEIARHSPGSGVRAWIRLGRIHERAGDIGEARESYTAALKIDPKNAQALQALARLR